MEGGSSLLGSGCLLGRSLTWGRAGLGKEDGSAQRSFCELGLGKGVGGHRRAPGKEGLLDQRRVCRGRKTRGALSTGSCFLSALSIYAVVQLAAGGGHLSPPFPLSPGGNQCTKPGRSECSLCCPRKPNAPSPKWESSSRATQQQQAETTQRG